MLAVGLAIEEGKLSLDDRVADLFPELVPEEHSPYLEELRVRHLLNMTSGHGQAFMGALQRSEIEDPFWARYYMKQPLVRRPGERFLYDSANSYLLGYAIVRRTGQDLEEYLRPRVLEPLGIKAQLIIVWPQKDTVIVTTGGVSVERCEAQIVMDLAWEHLDPERL